jgi:hypothetical protein
MAATAVLASTAIALAATPVTPKIGWFEAPTTSQHNIYAAGVKVAKVGKRLSVGLNTGVEIHCTNGGPVVGLLLRTKNTVPGEPGGNLGNPLPLKNGKFSLERTLPFTGGGTIKADVSGSFKSATKVVGAISLSEGKVPYAPELTCSSGKVTYIAKYVKGQPSP